MVPELFIAVLANKWWFCNSFIAHSYWLVVSWEEPLCPLPDPRPAHIYFLSFYQCRLKNYSMSQNPWSSLFIMLLKLSPVWPVESPSGWGVSFWHASLFFFLFEYFLIFWRNKILQTHLVLFQLQPWNQPCLQGALVLFSEWWYLDTKIWVRGVLRGLTASGPGF